jgi:preprotein translocase subunit SecF
MNTAEFMQNWALWVAGVPVAIVLVSVAWLLYRRSSRGQLNRAIKNHAGSMKELDAANASVGKLEKRVERLGGKTEKVKPRVLQEAKDALDDARALAKILADKSQVSAQQLRRVIFEEYPPAVHEKLRAKYLPQDIADDRPFTF